MQSPMQNITTRLTALETKIDHIIATPTMPPEVNLEGLTAMLGQILAKTTEMHAVITPQVPIDLSAQVQQALVTLQNLQLQLQQQAQQITIPVNPELIEL